MASYHNALVVVVLVSAARWSHGTHFRGASLWWKPLDRGIPNQVELSLRVAWRRSYKESTFCDADTIRSRRLIGPPTAGYLMCSQGCPADAARVGDVRFSCTDFSEAQDWTMGTRSYNFTFPGPEVYVITWTGRGWLETAAHEEDAEWALRLLVDLRRRQDTGRANTAPKAAMAPIVRLQLGCQLSVTIPMIDEDQDVVRCRWPDPALLECGGVCTPPPGVILHQNECRLEFQTAPAPGYYALALQVEDFAPGAGRDGALSSAPLQFLAQFYTSSGPCTAQPTFVPPTPSNGACVGEGAAAAGEEVVVQIVVRLKDEFTSVREVTTVSEAASGLTRGPVLPAPGLPPNTFAVNVTWTPTAPADGRTEDAIFCFNVIDSNGISSEQRCVYLIFGASPPEPTGITASENGDYIRITYNQMVELGVSGREVVRVVSAAGERLTLTTASEPGLLTITGAGADTLQIRLPRSAGLSGPVHVLMDEGVVGSRLSCDRLLPAAAVTSPASLAVSLPPPPPDPEPETTEAPRPTTTPASATSTSGEEVTSAPPVVTPGPALGGGGVDYTAAWVAVAVVCSLLLLVLLVAAVVAVVRRRRQARNKDSESRQLEHWAHLQNLRMGYDGPYQPDFNSIDVKFR